VQRRWIPAIAGMTAEGKGEIKMGPSLRWDDDTEVSGSLQLQAYSFNGIPFAMLCRYVSRSSRQYGLPIANLRQIAGRCS
jgi:hypothetical protein